MTEHKQNSPKFDCMGDNAFFRRGKRDRFRFHHQNNADMNNALKGLLPDPDVAYKTAQILKHGSRTHGGIVTFNAKSYYLKRYNNMGLWYRLRHLFKQSRAVRTWNIGWSFYNNKVSVPKPLVCLEERRWLFLHRSYILMECVENSEPLISAWSTLSTNQKCCLVTNLASELSKMHSKSLSHGDLKWSNILVNSTKDDTYFTLVDLDSCSCSKLLAKARFRSDVKLFLRWLKHYETDQEQLKKLLTLWDESYSFSDN